MLSFTSHFKTNIMLSDETKTDNMTIFFTKEFICFLANVRLQCRVSLVLCFVTPLMMNIALVTIIIKLSEYNTNQQYAATLCGITNFSWNISRQTVWLSDDGKFRKRISGTFSIPDIITVTPIPLYEYFVVTWHLLHIGNWTATSFKQLKTVNENILTSSKNWIAKKNDIKLIRQAGYSLISLYVNPWQRTKLTSLLCSMMRIICDGMYHSIADSHPDDQTAMNNMFSGEIKSFRMKVITM